MSPPQDTSMFYPLPITFDAHYPSIAERFTRAIGRYSTEFIPLSKYLSDRVPVEVWQAIASLTVESYRVLFIDDSIRYRSHEPKHEVNLDKNKVRDMLNICLVSKAFRVGVKTGFRDHFSGQIRLWSGNSRPELCNMIKTKMASHVTQLHIHIVSTETPVLHGFRAEWSQFIRSRGFSNLQEVKVTAPYSFERNAFFNAILDDEDLDLQNEAAEIEATVAEAGLDASIPCAFQIQAYYGDKFSQALSGDLSAFGLEMPDVDTAGMEDFSGRATTDLWERDCSISIALRLFEWLWTQEYV